jgi:hypothetical protein
LLELVSSATIWRGTFWENTNELFFTAMNTSRIVTQFFLLVFGVFEFKSKEFRKFFNTRFPSATLFIFL